jgi:serine/threonine-protein kinase
MIGSVLEGKYRIVRLMGEGGMGVVYEAEHTLIGR